MPGGHHVFESVPRSVFVPVLAWNANPTLMYFSERLVVIGMDVKQRRIANALRHRPRNHQQFVGVANDQADYEAFNVSCLLRLIRAWMKPSFSVTGGDKTNG
jgi:predicted aminopeptidase